MKRIPQSPNHLVRNQYSYCFRINVPKDLQKRLGKKELRYSLKTGYLSDARIKARALSTMIQMIFRSIRKGDPKLMKLTETEINEMIKSYYKKLIDGYNQPSPPIDVLYKDGICVPTTLTEVRSYIRELEYFRDEYRLFRNTGQYEVVEKDAEKLLRDHGIEKINKENPLYWKLCAGLLESQIKGIEYNKSQWEGKACNEKNADVPVSDGSADVSLDELSKDFLNWGTNESKWKIRSQTEFENCLNHMLDFLGRKRMINSVTPQDMVKYKEHVTIRKIGKKRLEFYMSRAKAFFRYAIDEKKVLPSGQNPVDGLIPKFKKKERISKRKPFDADDLTKLFHSKEYMKDTHNESYKFWLPILGLFTGARLEELCQLYIKDVKQEEGVWVLDIDEDIPDKSVKNSERRLVPLHPFITDDLHFISFVKSINPKDGRVFQNLKKTKNRYGHYPGRWFGSYKKKCGIDMSPNVKVFHSFRKTVTTHLMRKSVPEYQIKMMVGHSNEDDITVGSTYGEPLRPDLLMDQVAKKLDYGIDLSHLKNSKYVPK